MNKERWVLLALALGFATLVAEVRYLHRHVVNEYWQGYIPLAYGVLAIVACFLAMSASRTAKGVAAMVFALGLIVGGFGLYNHVDGDFSRLNSLVTLQPAPREIEEEGEEEGESSSERSEAKPEDDPPAFAPMGIAGLALIGAIVAWPGRKG